MEPARYLKVFRERWWIIALTVVIVTVAAVGLSLLVTPTYSAEVRILVSEQNRTAALLGNQLPELSSQPERALQTQVELMQMRPLAEEVIETLGLSVTPRGLLRSVTIEDVPQTNIVTITVFDEDPDTAAAIANGLADAYVAWSRRTKRQAIRDAVAAISEMIDEYSSTAVDDAAFPILSEMLVELTASEQLEVGSGTVVQPAIAASDPDSPQPVRNGILGLVLGLGLGFGLAVLADVLDDRVWTADEAAEVFGAPVLARIPVDPEEKG